MRRTRSIVHGRVEELEERYADTLPTLQEMVELLGLKADKYLGRMGAIRVWQ